MNNQLYIFKFNFDSFHLCVWAVVQKVKFSLWVWWSLELKGFLPMCYSMKMWPCPKICYQAINTMAPPNLPSSAIWSSALGNISFYSRYLDFYQISKGLKIVQNLILSIFVYETFWFSLHYNITMSLAWAMEHTNRNLFFFWLGVWNMMWGKKIENQTFWNWTWRAAALFTRLYPIKTRWKSQQSMKEIVHHFSLTGFRKLPHTISTKTANV